MQEPYIRTDDIHEVRLISDAVINLYAAHVHSLLYPHDHPLVSDSVRNAFQRLQKAFRKNRLIRMETSGGRLLVNGESLEGDILVLDNFASWLSSMDIKAVSFTEELTRRELIIFHKIISKRNVTSEEVSMALSEKNITTISVYPLEFSEGTAETGSSDGISQQGLSNDHDNTMFYMEGGQGQAPFFTATERAGQPDSATKKGLCKDYISTMYQTEGPGISSPLVTNSAHEKRTDELTGNARYAESVEALIDNELPRERGGVIREIPPPEMAHLLNAMLFKPPHNTVVDRITETYFSENSTGLGGEIGERCKTFLEKLKADLRPSFLESCVSICKINGLYTKASADPLEPSQMKPALSLLERREGMLPDSPPFILCRTLENSDFTFDFIANGNAVIHDIEIPQKTAILFNGSNLDQFRNKDVRDTLPPDVRAMADDNAALSGIIAECTDDAIADTSFEVILDMLESNCLGSDEYWKLEGKLSAHVELSLEKGDFGKILEVFNSLKRQSLQGTWSTHASAMLRNIFSSDGINVKVVAAVRQHGRKQRENAGKLTGALRSFLIPYLLDALCEESDSSTRRYMMTLLTSFRSDALQHISKRLRDSRWYVSRNMLYLLRECHGRSYAPGIRDFLEHEVPIVRLEALRTLLSFQDPDADVYVIKFLKSTVFQLQKGAVRLAGAYRIKSAMPHLIKLLQEKDLLGKRSLFKKGIVRALGRIGDSNAVNHLLNICRTESVLNKNEFSDLKIEIFRTLNSYPAATIGPLLDYGMQSTDKKIVAISRKLMNRYKPPAGKERHPHDP